MKNFSKFALWGLLLSFLSGCTGSLSLQVLRPADINIPKDIKTLALVNRYKPDKKSTPLNILEGLLSGEGIGNDRKGAEASLDGLSSVLSGSPRFNTIRPAIDIKGNGLGFFPDPMKPEEVRSICDSYKANAIVTVEAFDSDSKLEYGIYEKTVKQNNVDVKVPVHTAKATVNVTVGWRIYHSFDGSLLDEYRMTETMYFTGEGASQVAAAANLPKRESIVQQIGAATGDNYAYRISPAYIWVSRQWFSKAGGNQSMKAGKNFMHADLWEKAKEQYLKATQDPKLKVQGRALYNLALLAEVDGDLKNAIDYCDQSIEKGNKDAYAYKRILNDRVNDEQRLDQQMK